MFLLCAVLCVIIYFTLTQEDDGLTREQRKAEKARIKAAKAAAKAPLRKERERCMPSETKTAATTHTKAT